MTETAHSPAMNLPWNEIDTVFLDMDGTLLDLNFDTYFWTEHVPKRYAETNGMGVQEAKEKLYPRMYELQGTMDWYCLDFWTRELDLDIPLLKEEVDHLIQVFPYVIDFMDAVRNLDKRLVLVTNAHMKSVELKMRKTPIGDHLDRVICSHDFGVPKEHESFWRQLQKKEPFAPTRTLMVDDSLPVLRSAKAYGIRYLLGVHQPDTKKPPRESGGFDVIHSFRDIMPDAE